MELAVQIRDEENKRASLSKVMKTWAILSPKEAKTWLTSSTLPESEKQTFIRMCDYIISNKLNASVLQD